LEDIGLSGINNVFEIFLFFMGLVCGVYFFLLGRKQYTHLRFLGVFLMSYNFFYSTNIATYFEVPIRKVGLLPLYFLYLSLPVFVLYIKKISIFGLKKRDYLVLLPALLEFLYVFYLWCFKDPEIVRETTAWTFYILGAFIFNILLALVVTVYLVRHLRTYKKRYTHRGRVQLQWARNVVITVVGSLILLANLRYLGHTKQVFIINHLYDFCMLSSFVFFGYLTKNTASFTKKIKDYSLTEAASFEIRDKIQDYLMHSEDYLQKEFTILQLHNAIQVSPHKISVVLNLLENKSFNSYINELRVEKVKEIFEKVQYQKYTIEAIGMEVGFNSKSVFYREFKKYTKHTPSEYRKLIASKSTLIKKKG